MKYIMAGNMFYFGIPLISKGAALNWPQAVQLLNSTLGSIAQQTDKRFHCLIACHDIPPIEEAYKPFVTFLPVDMPIPQGIMEMRRDKGRKKKEIGMHLRKLGGGYLMFLDSDDLVHKDLVKHVLEQGSPNGYIIYSGFEYNSGSSRLMLHKNFNHICGSCGIFRLDPEDLPKDADDNECFFSKLQSHKEFENVCRAHGRPLTPIIFPAAVYLRTADITISTRFFKTKGLKSFKKHIKELMLRKKLTPEICQDFRLSA